MNFANKGELKSAVADWVNRNDLGSRMDGLISLAELRINRTLRTSEMEENVTLQTEAGNKSLVLPLDLLEVHTVSAGDQPLTYETPVNIVHLGRKQRSGKPNRYTIVGRRVLLHPTPDTVFDVDLVYFKRIPQLSSDADSNWLLGTAPDIYLHATCLEAASFLGSPQPGQKHSELLQQSMQALGVSDRRMRFSGHQLISKPVGTTP